MFEILDATQIWNRGLSFDASMIYAALTGLTAHLCIFIHGEWHLRAPSVLIIHVLMAVALSAVTSLGYCAAIFASYLTTLFSSMIIYRLFFHRLRDFNGPRLFAATKLWHVFLTLNCKNFRLLEKLHKQYGNVIRTGPNEITIFHPMATMWLDLTKNQMTKTDWYDMVLPRTSSIFTRDEDEHTARRRLWDQAFSVKNTSIYISRILRHLEALHEFIEKANGEPILINDMMAWYAFDAMGDFVYGRDFGMLKNSRWRPVMVKQKKALALLAPLNDTIWIVRLAFAFAPFYGKTKEFLKMMEFCDERMKERMESKTNDVDLASYFIEEYHALEGQRSLKERKGLLSGNAASAVIAGSDTTSPALTCVTYLLAKHPEHAQKIFQELQGIDITDSKALAALPHLNGAINESLRLFPPAMTVNTRIAPPQGLWIEDTFIPGGTKLIAPKYVIMRSDEAFEDASSFIPERWYSRPEMVRVRAAFAPFGSGHRQCAGKNIALVQLRLVISSIIQKYTFDFAPGFNAENVEEQMKDQVTCRPGACWIVYKSRLRMNA